MTIDELIKELGKVRLEHGNLPVYGDMTESGSNPTPEDFAFDGVVEIREEIKAVGEFDEWHTIPEPKRVVIW